MTHRPPRNHLRVSPFAIALLAIGTGGWLHAQDIASSPLIVEAESESDALTQGPFLPATLGPLINSGKRTSVIDLDEFPRISANNYRQAFAKTPGLVVVEETTPLVSIGYRGLDAHRAQFLQILKDGIPIHADMVGYPESYYTPPLDTVDRIEFTRGGASLQYGPQPGGALNYVTHQPSKDHALAFRTLNTFGSDGLYTNFTYLDGTTGNLGYYGYYNHRQADGFRESNSDYRLDSGHVKLVYQPSESDKITLWGDYYEEEHGEPGGLTFATGANRVNYNNNRNAVSRPFDEFRLQRYFGGITWEHDFGPDTFMSLKTWAGYYKRYSQRQRGGGFGVLPTGAAARTNDIENQEFYTRAAEARLRHHWSGLGAENTLALGSLYSFTDSPREDLRGNSPAAVTGQLRNKSDRESEYLSIFMENRFRWGDLSVTPGVRIEHISQSVNEIVNFAKTSARQSLSHEERTETVPLLGLGLAYALLAPENAAGAPGESPLPARLELYANASQSYRPVIFTQAVPTGGNTIVNRNLNDSLAWTYEAGLRGVPYNWLTFDTSFFYLDFDDQIGSIALPGGFSSVENIGRSIHYGVDVVFDLDLFHALDRLDGRDRSGWGMLSLYGNMTWLKAEVVSGPLDGREAISAPEFLFRAGLRYNWRDTLKASFQLTHSTEYHTDAGNAREREVPGYLVCDLIAEARLTRHLTLVAGINNIFDEDYYSRIRNDGIDPAPRRNVYLGVSVGF